MIKIREFVCWVRPPFRGRRRYPDSGWMSRLHLVDPEDTTRTVCGVEIPRGRSQWVLRGKPAKIREDRPLNMGGTGGRCKTCTR
mgnify:CR=1 FL=1